MITFIISVLFGYFWFDILWDSPNDYRLYILPILYLSGYMLSYLKGQSDAKTSL